MSEHTRALLMLESRLWVHYPRWDLGFMSEEDWKTVRSMSPAPNHKWRHRKSTKRKTWGKS